MASAYTQGIGKGKTLKPVPLPTVRHFSLDTPIAARISHIAGASEAQEKPVASTAGVLPPMEKFDDGYLKTKNNEYAAKKDGEYVILKKREKNQEAIGKLVKEQNRLKEKGNSVGAVFPVKAIKTCVANGANVPEGTLGTLEGTIITWDNGEYTVDAKRFVDYEILKKDEVEAIMREGDWDDERFGQEVTAEDLGKAFADLSGMDVGDLVAVQRSDGRWTYALAMSKAGSTRGYLGTGLMLNFRTANGERKQYPFNEWNKVKQLRKPQPKRGWGNFGGNPLLAKVGEACSTEDFEKASADLSRVCKGDVVADLRSDGRWTYAMVQDIIGSTRTGQVGTGLLLRVDQSGSEKKVLDTEAAGNVKALSTKA
jgi:hypothetical protein